MNELTPNLNFRKNSFFKYKKAENPLQQTKESYLQRNKYTEIELKEFSILFLVINKLDIFRKNIELISEITFSSNVMNELKKKIIEYLLSGEFFDKKVMDIEDLDKKFVNVIKDINSNAPVKIIYKRKNDEEITLIFNEIASEMKKIQLTSGLLALA